jgi:2-polyprenyl-6-methoxyphenol hydroxylase-like FAD-dependent oxidoreductase
MRRKTGPPRSLDPLSTNADSGATDVLIIGGGIGGLVLALSLHELGVRCRVLEAAPEFKPLGVGINLLPHATRELAELGLERRLAAVAVTTRASAFYNRFGQLIYCEPVGRYAGYEWPQFSIHRGDLHAVLVQAVRERLGADAIVLGHRCVGVEQDASGVTARFVDPQGGAPLGARRGSVAIACDGIHSAVRKQLHPHEGPPVYSGVNMWRGVTRWKPYLSGATMARAGWLATGKMVVYPIRNDFDSAGRQLVNWVAEIETLKHRTSDWNRPGRLEDFIAAFAGWRFDWLDVEALIRGADAILEFPMVDQDPLSFWTAGRITLLGDAAHPMLPRGSNGAGQAILDARTLAGCLAREPDGAAALKAYEAVRLEAANKVVLTNRTTPPDVILREVWQRTGDKPFARIEDVISEAELAALSGNYQRIAGYAREMLANRGSLAEAGRSGG